MRLRGGGRFPTVYSIPQNTVKVKQLCRAGTKWGGKQAESTNKLMLCGNVTRNNRRYEAKLLM